MKLNKKRNFNAEWLADVEFSQKFNNLDKKFFQSKNMKYLQNFRIVWHEFGNSLEMILFEFFYDKEEKIKKIIKLDIIKIK